MSETSIESPATLWHYTDAGGCLGILGSNQFRFGNARFLNDRTEQLYGERVRQAMLAAAIADGDPSGILRRILGRLERAGSDRLYLCSLSATRESISQWQRYGADGTGYCLGFDTMKLDSVFARDGIIRLPIIYGPQEQKVLLRESIAKAEALMRRAGDLRKVGGDALVQGIDIINAAEKQLKNRHFQDEAEWRYLALVPDDDDEGLRPPESFSVRGSFIKPFVVFPRDGRIALKPLLPLTHVVCGPRLDWELAEQTIRLFLRCHGYSSVAVERSELADVWR
jgi:hypothetical protein